MENSTNIGQQEQIRAAMKVLKDFIYELSMAADKGEEYGSRLWERIEKSTGVLREVAYYHDYGDFWGQYRVAGYTLPDIVIWQVDHFKLYMDRHEAMNRFRRERLFLESLETMLDMEENPEPIIKKMTTETGTDF